MVVGRGASGCQPELLGDDSRRPWPPHSMPVWGVWLRARERWWFSCAATSAKVGRLETNPHVVVAADNTVEVVSLEGVAVRDDGRYRDEVVDAYLAKYGAEIIDAEETPEQARASTSTRGP